MGKMSVSIYKKGEYEDFHAFGRRKNKPNSKPISNGMSAFCLWCKRLPRPIGPRNDISISAPLWLCASVANSQFEKTSLSWAKSNGANLFRIECCVMRIAKTKLKKQTQFVGGQIERKLLPERGLRRNSGCLGCEKQTQFYRSAFCGLRMDSRLRGNDKQ